MNQNNPVAGVDVSKDYSDMCILAPDNTVFRKLKIYHDLTSMNHSLSTLHETETTYGIKPVVVMESTSHYHRLLWQFLSNSGYEVIVINPLQSGGLRNINIRKLKNDKVDAYKIAMLYRLKLLKPSNMPVNEIAALRSLCRLHQDIKDDITQYTNRLMALLDQAFPKYCDIFSRITCKTSLAVLERFPTPHDILNASKHEIFLLIKDLKIGVMYSETKAEKIFETATDAIQLGIYRNADAILIRSCVSTIKLMLANVDAIDDEMRSIVANNSFIKRNTELLRTIPGIGEYSSAFIISEIGDIAYFRKPKQLIAYFGLDPSERISGKFKGDLNKISKRGSPYVRGVLNMVAHNCIHKTLRNGKIGNPILADYYEKKRISKPHKLVICAIMSKIVGIIFAVLRDQKPFEFRTPESHDFYIKNRYDPFE